MVSGSKGEKITMLALFVFGVLFLAVGVILFFTLKGKKAVLRVLLPVLLCMGGAVLAIVSCIRTVPTGHTGIVTTFGRVEDVNYEAGVHFTAPWKEVVNMDNRNQRESVDLLCFSSDIQEVTVRYTVNYQISKQNAQTIYKEIGQDYYNIVIVPMLQQGVKSEFAKYTAEELLNNRRVLSDDIMRNLTEKLAGYNIIVIDASIENLDFSDVFTDAVEAKQVAEQRSKQAKIEQEQQVMEAEAAAKRAEIEAKANAAVAKIAAEADLDVVKIQADAAEYAGQKDAAVIGQIRDILAKDKTALTDEDVEHLLVYYYIQKWSGTLPETYFSSDDFYQLLAALGKSQAGSNP